MRFCTCEVRKHYQFSERDSLSSLREPIIMSRASLRQRGLHQRLYPFHGTHRTIHPHYPEDPCLRCHADEAHYLPRDHRKFPNAKR